jgi:hypothetical protein
MTSKFRYHRDCNSTNRKLIIIGIEYMKMKCFKHTLNSE